MNSLFQKLIILQKERIKVLQKRRIIHTLNYQLVLNIWQLCVQNIFQKPNLPLLSRSICIHVETVHKAMRRLSSNPESPKDLRFHDWCIRSWRFWQSSGTSWCANNPTRPRRRFALGRMFPPIPLGRPSQNQAVLVAPVVRDEPTDERFHFVPRCSFCLAVGKYGGDSKQQKYELSNNTIWPEVEKTTQAKNCCSELRKNLRDVDINTKIDVYSF